MVIIQVCFFLVSCLYERTWLLCFYRQLSWTWVVARQINDLLVPTVGLIIIWSRNRKGKEKHQILEPISPILNMINSWIALVIHFAPPPQILSLFLYINLLFWNLLYFDRIFLISGCLTWRILPVPAKLYQRTENANLS